MIKFFFIQDTIKHKTIVRQDSIKQFSDSSASKNKVNSDSANPVKTVLLQPVVKIVTTDTTSVCCRNSIADITFYDSTSIIKLIDASQIQNFPFFFTENNRKFHEKSKSAIVRHLKSGEGLPSDNFHTDWVLPVIFLSLLLYGIIKAGSGKFFQGILKFISFRAINESASRHMGALYQWQSTLFNLASFISISLFVLLTTIWYGLLPFEGKKFIYWLLSLAIIISSFTVRHFICIIVGNMSGEKELFREYLIGIYYTYRLAGVFLIIITVLILYTAFIPIKFLFYIGFSVIALMYLIRVFYLFLIFINRHASIFYLILYLCALEILPVVIIVKYVTGLV